MPIFVLFLLLLLASPVWAVTRLVTPGGSGSDSTCTSVACTLSRAVSLAQPGDTITLANGTYTGSTTINCNSGAQNGTTGAHIILKATNERLAYLVGSGAAPLQFYNCNFWETEGLHVSNDDNGASVAGSPGSVIWLSNSNNMIVRRNLVHHPNRYANAHGIEFYIADNNLVEENEVYDFHRHGIIIQTGSGNIFRRNYVNSRGWPDLQPCNNTQNGVDPWCSNQPAGDSGLMVYPAANTIMENNISIGNGFGCDMNAKYGNSENNHYYGNIAIDNYYGFSLTAGDQPYVSDMPLNSVWRNNISITGGTTNRGFRARSTKNLHADNNTVIGSGAEAAWMVDWDSANGPGDGSPTSYMTNLLVTKSASSSDYGISVTGQSDWSLDYVNVFNFTNNTPSLGDSHITHATTTNPNLGSCLAWLPDGTPMKGTGLGGADIGANVLYRYQDGALSSVPLWDTSTGAFPCGAVVPGFNDTGANTCTGVANRLNINQNGCSFPAGYAQVAADYRLQPTSPLRNAALCLAGVPLDIVGYTRISSCDMGAYEFQVGGQVGTIAKYPFSEGSGLTVADATGRGHTGNFLPNGGWVAGGTMVGPYAGSFDGTRYVTISGVSELRPITEAAVSGWFKATTTDVGGSAIIALPNDGLLLYLTSLGRAACQLYDELGSFITITSAASYINNVKHFASCSYLKGDGLYLRVDHTQVGFTAGTTDISYSISGTQNVELGRSSGNTTNLNFIGTLDDITLRDTACDTACDLQLFQEGLAQRRIVYMGSH